jgi:hypothetical protein
MLQDYYGDAFIANQKSTGGVDIFRRSARCTYKATAKSVAKTKRCKSEQVWYGNEQSASKRQGKKQYTANGKYVSANVRKMCVRESMEMSAKGVLYGCWRSLGVAKIVSTNIIVSCF